MIKGRVALERIQIFPIFWRGNKLAKISQAPNFGSGRIRPTCLQTLLIEIYVTINSSQIFLHAACSWLSALQQLVIFGPIIGRAVLLGLPLCCCLRHLRRRRLSRWSRLFKLLPVTGFRVRVIGILIKTPLVFLLRIERTVKSVRCTG